MITRIATISIDEETGEYHVNVEGRGDCFISNSISFILSFIGGIL